MADVLFDIFVVVPAVFYGGMIGIGGLTASHLLSKSPSWEAFKKGALITGVAVPALIIGSYYVTKSPAPKQEDYVSW